MEPWIRVSLTGWAWALCKPECGEGTMNKPYDSIILGTSHKTLAVLGCSRPRIGVRDRQFASETLSLGVRA